MQLSKLREVAAEKLLKMDDFRSVSKSTKALYAHQDSINIGKTLSGQEEHAITTRLFIDLIINIQKRVGDLSVFNYIIDTAESEFELESLSQHPKVETMKQISK